MDEQERWKILNSTLRWEETVDGYPRHKLGQGSLGGDRDKRDCCLAGFNTTPKTPLAVTTRGAGGRIRSLEVLCDFFF